MSYKAGRGNLRNLTAAYGISRRQVKQVKSRWSSERLAGKKSFIHHEACPERSRRARSFIYNLRTYGDCNKARPSLIVLIFFVKLAVACRPKLDCQKQFNIKQTLSVITKLNNID